MIGKKEGKSENKKKKKKQEGILLQAEQIHILRRCKLFFLFFCFPPNNSLAQN